MSDRQLTTKGELSVYPPGKQTRAMVEGLIQHGFYIFHLGAGVVAGKPGTGGTLTLEKRVYPTMVETEEGISREAVELLRGIPLDSSQNGQMAANTLVWSHPAQDDRGNVKYTRVFCEILGVDKDFIYEVAGLLDEANDQAEVLNRLDGEFTDRVIEEVEREPEVRKLREKIRDKQAEILVLEQEAERLVLKKAGEREGRRADYRYVVNPREL